MRKIRGIDYFCRRGFHKAVLLKAVTNNREAVKQLQLFHIVYIKILFLYHR